MVSRTKKDRMGDAEEKDVERTRDDESLARRLGLNESLEVSVGNFSNVYPVSKGSRKVGLRFRAGGDGVGERRRC